jgi:hypothetical protein
MLPLFELSVWAVMIPIQAGLMWYWVHETAQNSETVSIHAGQFEVTLPRDRLLTSALISLTSQRSHIITAINLPGMFVEVLISLPTSWPGVWHPEALPVDSWRSCSLPFYCLPAWWLVGRGIDGLLGRRRLHLAMLLTGSILFLIFLVPLVAFFWAPTSDRADMAWLLPAFGFWALAFGVLPLAWLRQRKHIPTPLSA